MIFDDVRKSDISFYRTYLNPGIRDPKGNGRTGRVLKCRQRVLRCRAKSQRRHLQHVVTIAMVLKSNSLYASFEQINQENTISTMVDDVQQQEPHKDGEQVAGKKRDVSSAIAVDASTGAVASTAEGEVAASGSPPDSNSLLNVPKRTKTEPRNWLAAPKGERHTRVGDDFQVAALPSPSSPPTTNQETGKDVTNEKAEEKSEEPVAVEADGKQE